VVEVVEGNINLESPGKEKEVAFSCLVSRLGPPLSGISLL
jgi:hypothetical protein